MRFPVVGCQVAIGNRARRVKFRLVEAVFAGALEVAESYGIAQGLHGRDAVLPVGAGFAAHAINRPRLGVDGEALPCAAGLAAQAEVAWACERDADDVADGGFITVPADGGAGCVFADEGAADGVGWDAGEGGDAAEKGGEEAGHRAVPAVADQAAVGFVAVVFIVLERQGLEGGDEGGFLGLGEEIFRVGKAAGHGFEWGEGAGEEGGLEHIMIIVR